MNAENLDQAESSENNENSLVQSRKKSELLLQTMTDLELWTAAGLNKIRATNDELIGIFREAAQFEESQTLTRQKIILRRIRHQICIYKVFNYFGSLRKAAIKQIIIQSTDNHAQTANNVKEFNIPLSESCEGEMINKFARLMEYSSGYLTWCKARSWPKLGGAGTRSFEKTHLSVVYWFTTERKRWRKLPRSSRTVNSKNQVYVLHRNLLVSIWQNITGRKLDDHQLAIALNKKHFGSVRHNKRRPSNDGIIAFPIDILTEINAYFDSKMASVKPIHLFKTGDGRLTRGGVLDTYAQLALEGLIVEVGAHNYLMDALLKLPENRHFWIDKDTIVVTLGDNSQKKLSTIARKDFENAKRVQLPGGNKGLEMAIRQRIDEIRLSFPDLLSFPAGKTGQVDSGLSYEDLLGELAQLITLQGAFTPLCNVTTGAALEYIQLIEKVRSGEWVLNPKKSMTNLANTRKTSRGNGSPIDHIFCYDQTDGTEASIYVFMSDKKAAVRKGRRGKWELQMPINAQAKEDLINMKHFAEGNPEGLEHDEGQQYQKGMLAGIGEKGTEKGNLDQIYREFTALSNSKRLLIQRNMLLRKNAAGSWVFSITLQCGTANQGTFFDAIQTLRSIGGDWANLAVELMKIANQLSSNILLSRVFWIKRPTGGFLSPGEIFSNLKEGLRRIDSKFDIIMKDA